MTAIASVLVLFMEPPALSPEGSASSFHSAREGFEHDPFNSNQVQVPQGDAGLAQWDVYAEQLKIRIDSFNKAYEVWLQNKPLHAMLHCQGNFLPVQHECFVHSSNKHLKKSGRWMLSSMTKPNPINSRPQAANAAYNQGAAPKSFTGAHRNAMQATVQDMLAVHTKVATMVQRLKVATMGKDTVCAMDMAHQPSAQEEM